LKGGGRYYNTPAGAYPSVTTILKAIAKEALIQWTATVTKQACIEAAADLYEQRTVFDDASRAGYITQLDAHIGKARAHIREMEKAGDIGTKVHKMIEWTLRTEMGGKGDAPELCRASAMAFSTWEQWRKLVELEPIDIEQMVWSDKYSYAGTMDLYGKVTLPEIGRVNVIIDWKTGKGIYNEALLQNAAYTRAYEEMGHGDENMYGMVVRLPKRETDPPLEVRIVSPHEFPVLFKTFLSTLNLWRWLNRDLKWLQEIDEYNRKVQAPATKAIFDEATGVPEELATVVGGKLVTKQDLASPATTTLGPQTMAKFGDVAEQVLPPEAKPMAIEGTSLSDEQRWARILKVAARRIKDEKERAIFIGQVDIVLRYDGIDAAEKAFRDSKWGKKHGV
jgi:hypothetical protein